MKKLLFTLIILLSILSIGCEKKPTEPTTTNNNGHSQSFTGNFTFGTFGNVSALFINEDGSIYMNMDNVLLTIKKEMVTKISDSQYTIKGQMPTIKYDTSSAAAKSIMFTQNASDMNTVDVSLNLSGGNLSLSGTINNNSVSGNLKEVSGYIPNDYAGIYYMDGNQNNTGIEIKSDGYVIIKRMQNGNTNLEQKYNDKLIKLSENEYLLNEGSLENNSLSSGQMTTSDAESILVAETLRHYNISTRSTLKFENSTITMETKRLNINYKDYNTISDYIQQIIKDISYTNQIDYSLITVKFENTEYLTFIKK